MNKKSFSAVIVDDERKSREVMLNLLSEYCPEVHISGQAADVESAYMLISTAKPDVVFLDIRLPGGTGFGLLEKFDTIPFHIIFTTSYDQYAVKAIKLSALDYLLKPINIDELVAAVNKVYNRQRDLKLQHEQVNIVKQKHRIDKLALPTQEGFSFITIDEIEYCEASSNYTYIHMQNKDRLLASRTLKEFDGLFADEGFCRIHQSYLINMRHISRYIKSTGTVLMKQGKELSVSVRKKEEFMEMLKRM